MSAETILKALADIRYPVSGSRTLPPACYHDSAWYGHELDRVFRKGWLCVGREDQWKHPGDYLALEIAGVQMVIIRQENMGLSALSNTCLHRGSLIVNGSGNSRALVCPFHGWTYDHAGRLISASRMQQSTGFNETDCRLHSFALDACGGFVFVSLEERPDSLDSWLDDFSGLHEPWSLEDLALGTTRTFDVGCNWKLFMEVFNEYYHLPYVHPDSINQHYCEPDPPDAVFGQFISQFGVTRSNPGLLNDDQGEAFPVMERLGERERSGTRYTWVYPNLTFAASMDCLWGYHVFPLSPTLTRVVQSVCFPSDTTRRADFAGKARSYYARVDSAIAEDIPVLEKQQAGLASPCAAQGWFSDLEPCVGNFACWYAERTVTPPALQA